jgi:hypothetical protein
MGSGSLITKRWESFCGRAKRYQIKEQPNVEETLAAHMRIGVERARVLIRQNVTNSDNIPSLAPRWK